MWQCLANTGWSDQEKVARQSIPEEQDLISDDEIIDGEDGLKDQLRLNALKLSLKHSRRFLQPVAAIIVSSTYEANMIANQLLSEQVVRKTTLVLFQLVMNVARLT